jgi:hypothetical protein
MLLSNYLHVLFGNPGRDAYTVSLLHMDGADASTTFTDESGKIWTANGNAQIDTAQSKFNGASLLSDGTGDWIATPDNDDFSFIGVDLTVEFWLRPNSVTGSQGLFGQEPVAAYPANFCERATTNIRWVIRKASGGNGDIIDLTTSGVTLAIGTWYHIALVKSATTYYIFVDGIQRATTTSATAVENIANEIRIADRSSTTPESLNGWIDEFRWSKGIARWTANFTPPVQAYK